MLIGRTLNLGKRLALKKRDAVNMDSLTSSLSSSLPNNTQTLEHASVRRSKQPLLSWFLHQRVKLSLKRQFNPTALQKHCPLDNRRLHPRVDATKGSLSSGQNISALVILPIEIICAILHALDLQTLTDFLATSWAARGLVDNLPLYSIIFRHCPNVLRALLSTRMAVHFNIQDL
jgi:hypothetical protein